MRYLIQTRSKAMKINGFESEVFELTNQVRRRHGLSPLQWNHKLIAAAQNYTKVMESLNCLSHNCDNSNLGERVKRAGYRFSYVGENVAHGYKTPEEAVRGWMNSSGHRKNLLNPNYQEIGVGYLNGYWTQVFGRR
jgi:uncharacterized protein YkwD